MCGLVLVLSVCVYWLFGEETSPVVVVDTPKCGFSLYAHGILIDHKSVDPDFSFHRSFKLPVSIIDGVRLSNSEQGLAGQYLSIAPHFFGSDYAGTKVNMKFDFAPGDGRLGITDVCYFALERNWMTLNPPVEHNEPNAQSGSVCCEELVSSDAMLFLRKISRKPGEQHLFSRYADGFFGGPPKLMGGPPQSICERRYSDGGNSRDNGSVRNNESAEGIQESKDPEFGIAEQRGLVFCIGIALILLAYMHAKKEEDQGDQ